MGATRTSVAFSVTNVGLLLIPISARVACVLSISNKVIYKISSRSYNRYKKQFQKDQQTFNSFDELEQKSLQDNLIH